MATKKHKIGDKVLSHLLRTSGEKIKVKGTIKRIDEYYGRKTYTITEGVVEDFATRTIS